MKKILFALNVISITLLFIGCSSDSNNNEDAALLQKVQGNWKLTEYVGDTPEQNVLVDDGFELELKSDKTFTSNEIQGYTGGKYSVIHNPGKNLRLVFKNSSGSIVLYKYINDVSENNIYAQAPQEEPLSDDYGYYGVQILTRIP